MVEYLIADCVDIRSDYADNQNLLFHCLRLLCVVDSDPLYTA